MVLNLRYQSEYLGVRVVDFLLLLMSREVKWQSQRGYPF